MPGVWDALSARIVAAAGFSTAFVSGFAVSGTLLGLPDVGHVGQTEMADVARRAAMAAPDLNLVVDADTGYGNAMNVARTVELWERSGAAGIFIEDQVWPKRCGHMEGKVVVPAAEWLEKLRAACSQRSHLHVTARTDARGARGLDEAIERGRMARDVGVDAVFVEAPESLEELDSIAKALPDVVLVANMVEKGRTPLLTPTELADRGFRLIVSPLSLLLSAARSMNDAASRLSATGTMRDSLDQLMAFDDFNATVGLPEHLKAQAEFGG
jgi:2-methylisocitrate lyase-like PEP mutase family enzyme